MVLKENETRVLHIYTTNDIHLNVFKTNVVQFQEVWGEEGGGVD